MSGLCLSPTAAANETLALAEFRRGRPNMPDALSEPLDSSAEPCWLRSGSASRLK